VVAELPHSVTVAGAAIRYGVTGTDGPDLVLIHGNGAHHDWWHQIAPALESRWRVIQLDLSGHGDSDRRDAYTPETWVAELVAVLDDVSSVRPELVGHSMGGRLALIAAALHPHRATGLVLLDSGVRPPERHRPNRPARRTSSPVYASREEAMARFRLLPAQPHPPGDVMAVLADRSLRAVDGGWTWKHDPRARLRFTDEFVSARAAEVTCPVGFVYGAESVVVDDGIADFFRTATRGEVRVERIDGAHHHLVLEEPEICIRLIDEMAADHLRTSVTPR
jgi:pimeloyl-ACP methyl ester carboxylesterase